MTTTFTLEHDFKDISLEKFENYLNDPKLNEMLKEGLSFDERKLIKKEFANEEEINWHFYVKKKGQIPKSLKNFITDDMLSWQETSRFVKKEHCIYWKIEPKIKNLKIKAQGVWKLKKIKNGTKRIIEGEISTDIPFVGKLIEAFIINELKKTYEIEPKIQHEFYLTAI